MEQAQPRPTLLQIGLKTIIVHTLTYFVMGLLASTLFSYASLFATSELSQYMRQIGDPMVMAGPLFQPLRGVLFGLVFYLLREIVFNKKNGWLIMWAVLVIVGIFSTFGPTPGSLEGMVYTRLPFITHLRGLPEVVIQALLLAGLTVYWVHHPENKWLNWVFGLAFFIVLLLPALGLLLGQPQ